MLMKDINDAATVARQVLKANCMMTTQVKEIMKSFSFESTQLQFAKEGYASTYDRSG